MGLPWSPPGEGVSVPQSPPEGRPNQPGGTGSRWRLFAVVGVLLIATVVTTAAITYALSKGASNQAPQTVESAPVPAASDPTYSPSEEAAAKAKLCKAFDESTRSRPGDGGLRVEGQVNPAVALRTLNSAVTVRESLSAAIPAPAFEQAEAYISSALALTTGALGTASIDEINRLTNEHNAALSRLADTCGLRG